MIWIKDAWFALKIIAAINVVVMVMVGLGVDHAESAMMAVSAAIIIPTTLALIGVGVVTARFTWRVGTRVCQTLVWETTNGLVNRATV